MNNLPAEDDHEGHVRKPLPPAEVIRKLPADGARNLTDWFSKKVRIFSSTREMKSIGGHGARRHLQKQRKPESRFS